MPEYDFERGNQRAYEKKHIINSALIVLAGIYPCLFCAFHLHHILSGKYMLIPDPLVMAAAMRAEQNILSFFLVFLSMLLIGVIYLINASSRPFNNETMLIIPGIRTPVPCSNNLHGSARWLRPKELKKAYSAVTFKKNNPVIRQLINSGRLDLQEQERNSEEIIYDKPLFPAGGLMIGQSKNGKDYYVVTEDSHTLVIGATRSGKSRGIVIPSICVTALAGESMVISDLKMELYLALAPFLKRIGYEVILLDFESPAKSDRYNFMQLINDQIEKNNITGAKAAVNELVEALAGKQSHNEKIWEEGEKSILACCIMAVAYDNRNNPRVQNLTNVYHFIANMCRPIDGRNTLPLQDYLSGCPEEHPARSLAGISNVAHARTRSSFYAAALATLRLFEDYNIADMTGITSFDHLATADRKRAIFIALPDEKPAYYSIASLFVQQHYQTLVGQARANGGRLPRRVEFFLDEVGNFTKIPYFEKLLTVGAGRGIRYHLFLQSFSQLEATYNQHASKIIRSNCETWVYLHSDDQDTVSDVSKRLGNYTAMSASRSAPVEGTGSGSASSHYISRPLMTTEEVKKVERPYQLVLSRNDPAILYAPDLIKTIFNEMLGLGDKEHNLEVNRVRYAKRSERRISAPYLWEIWKDYDETL